MAWTEQCKVAFRMNALGKLSKYKNKNRKVRGVLKELSKESGIPFNTLDRWYYERDTEPIDTNNGVDKSKSDESIDPKKKGDPKDPKPIDNFKRLNNHMKAAIDGLTLFAEGTMTPETEDEAEYAKAILAKAANFIIQYARLGADVQGIYETFIKPDESEKRKGLPALKAVN